MYLQDQVHIQEKVIFTRTAWQRKFSDFQSSSNQDFYGLDMYFVRISQTFHMCVLNGYSFCGQKVCRFGRRFM